MDYEDDDLGRIQRIHKSTLNGGKTLVELAYYDGASMWWNVHPMFLNVMSTDSYFPMRRARLLVRLFRIVGPYLLIVYDLCMKILMRLKNVPRPIRERSNGRERTIAFLTQNMEWERVLDSASGTYRKGDRFFQSLIEECQSRGYGILSFYPSLVQPGRGARILKEKLTDWEVAHVPLEMYADLSVWKKYLSASRHFREIWKSVRSDKTLMNISISDGITEHKKLMAHLEFYFTFLFPYLVRESGLCVNFIQREHPSVLVLTNEYGWIERSYLVSANREGVRTIGIQHGIIHPRHSGYIHDEENMQRQTSNPLHCPIPDITAVSGSYDYDLLTKLAFYPTDTVAITGQPRYDILFYASKLYSRRRFFERNGIDQNHKVVLWATQAHGLSFEENQKNYECVFNTIRGMKNVTLVVKQHPGEPESYTEEIRKKIDYFNVSNVVMVSKGSDMYELTYVCDILLTKTSTTAIEAIALDKPVIVLDLGSAQESADYVKDGVALEVRNAADLKSAINSILDGNYNISNIRNDYIARRLFRIDGESSKRTANLIEAMIP